MFIGAAVVLLVALAAYSWWGQQQIEKQYPPAGDFITVDGLRLHYIEQGPEQSDKPTIVLIHGASSNARDFAGSIMPLLAREHRVIAFDRPGFGYSDRPKDRWPSPAFIARLLLKACDQMGIENPVFVGHSWAGSVVMAGLLSEGKRLRGGVLLAGVAGHWVPDPSLPNRLANAPLLGPVFTHTLVYPLGKQLMPSAVDGIHSPNPVPPDYVTNIGAELILRPASFRHNAEDSLRLAAFLQLESSRYDEISKPLLVIHGDADTLVPWWNHGKRLTHVLDNIETIVMPGVGHAPHHTAPEAVSQHIVDFIHQT